MRKWMMGVGAVLVLGAAAGPAAADEGTWMVGVGGSFAGEEFDGTDFIGAFGNERELSIDDSRIWTAQAGYRINDYLAIEAEYERIDEFDFSDSESGGPFQADLEGDVGGWAATVNARVYPFERAAGMRPYLLVGAGYMELDMDATATISFLGDPLAANSASVDDKAAVLQAGLGFDYQLSEQWFVELEGTYRFPQSDLEDFRFFTVGAALQYRF